MCSHANNYATREAVCACLAELAERLEPAAIRPWLPAMLRILLSLLRDDSWPVRTPICASAVVFRVHPRMTCRDGALLQSLVPSPGAPR